MVIFLYNLYIFILIEYNQTTKIISETVLGPVEQSKILQSY